MEKASSTLFFYFFICHPVAKRGVALYVQYTTLSIHFPSPATYKIRNSHVIQLQQRRSIIIIIITGPIILQAIQSQLAAPFHHSSSIIATNPIVFIILPRVQKTMVAAAPKRCVIGGGGVFNRGAYKRAGINHSKWISEDGETGADY